MIRSNFFFTSESVTEGHPDKIADLISDSIADYLIDKNMHNRAAIETMVSSNMVSVAGESKSSLINNHEKIESIVRETVRKIGYEQDNFHWKNLKFINQLHGQSRDIALGTDNFGAGDQGMMFGYACEETPTLMPSSIYYSHLITKKLAEARHAGTDWIGPDGKAQVTFEYSKEREPLRISNVVCSTQHSKDIKIEDVRKQVLEIIIPVLKDKIDDKTKFQINPTGRFVIGGPDGDAGVTGRKIIVDTYGGYAPHGGGAFSGKDCTKVDRSGAYMTRYLAKNIVAQQLYKNATVQLSYAIGIEEPVSLYLYCDGQVRNELAEWIQKNVDLTPRGLINRFDLFNIDLTATTNYGHFGKNDLPWERIDLNIEEK
ncbi:MAG: methionine adenosyltransferase [Hydrogenophilales bacterium]